MSDLYFGGEGFDWLIGKKIVTVEEAFAPDDTHMDTDGYLLTCDDGTQLLAYENEGCGGCGNGWSSLPDLTELVKHDNVITNVKAIYRSDDPDLYEDYVFDLFVYYADKRFERLQGDDGYGNGYYGGGFNLRVMPKEKK